MGEWYAEGIRESILEWPVRQAGAGGENKPAAKSERKPAWITKPGDDQSAWRLGPTTIRFRVKSSFRFRICAWLPMVSHLGQTKGVSSRFRQVLEISPLAGHS